MAFSPLDLDGRRYRRRDTEPQDNPYRREFRTTVDPIEEPRHEAAERIKREIHSWMDRPDVYGKEDRPEDERK